MKTVDPRSHAVRSVAADRLAASRERIRASLAEASHPRQEEDEERPSMLMSALLAIPGAQTVVDAVKHWWWQHPMHLAGTLAANTARSMVGPMARRSPYALVLGAMAVGGLVFLIKPWRGIVRPALLAGLVPHLVSRVLAQIPIESWLSTLLAMVTLRGASQGHEEDEAGAEGAPAAATQTTSQAASPSAAATGAASNDASRNPPPSTTLH